MEPQGKTTPGYALIITYSYHLILINFLCETNFEKLYLASSNFSLGNPKYHLKNEICGNKSRVSTKGAAVSKGLCDWWDFENNVEKMVPVSCFGKVSEYFLSHPSQRLYNIQLKLKVAISENIPCHLSNNLSIKCNQSWPLRNQWIIRGKKVLV